MHVQRLASKKAWDALIPTRQSLLSRLRDLGDNSSWEDFFATYWKLIYRAAVDAGLTDAEAQDVVQETVARVAQKMPEFRYDPVRGTFKRWLLAVTKCAIVDQLRLRSPAVPFSQLDGKYAGLIERIPAPTGLGLESIWEREWAANQFEVVMRRLRTRLNPKYFQIFDLFVLKEWSAQKVSEQLRVSLAQVYVVKMRVSRLIRREIRKLEYEQNHGIGVGVG